MEIVKYPITTEKSVRMMESENKLVFVVDRHATKPQIKTAVEEAFKVKVVGVHTFISPAGEKRAYVKFGKEYPAIDVATGLGLL